LKNSQYAQAISEAERALTFRANDPAATALKLDAETKQKQAQTQAEQDRNYKQAMAAGSTALQGNDFTNALKQAGIALGYRANDGAALKLKSEAESGQKNLAAQAEREGKYKQAMAAGNEALKNSQYAQAISEAERALTFRANDPAATTLKLDAQQKQVDAQAQAAREKNYGVAMAAATNALNRAESAFKQLNYDEALKELNAGKSECDKARGQKATRDVNQLSELLDVRQSVIQQARDYRSATNNFAQGKYAEALQALSGASHENSSFDFQSLGKNILEEQALLENAKRDTGNDDYSAFEKLNDPVVAKKPPVQVLLQQAAKEKTDLAELRALQSTTNWNGVQSKFKNLSTENLLRKTPFKEIQGWAKVELERQEKIRADRAAQLNSQLECFKVWFGLSKDKKVVIPAGFENAGRRAELLGAIGNSRSDYDTLLTWLKDQYEKPLSPAMERTFSDLKKAIKEWE
jgi:hypothetical protein